MDNRPIINPPPAPANSAGEIPVSTVVAQKGDANDHHFATAHLQTDLKGRAVSSGVVTGLSQGIQFMINLVSMMVLARLLQPQDFGLVAMVWTITGFLRIFNDAGLSTATVQRDGITHAQVSNLFWTNIALGGTISLLLGICAPLIAWFYHEPRLVDVTLAICIVFLLASSTVQHQALIKRQMRFKVIAMIDISAALIGVLVGIGMALWHYGYWSLVWMQLATSVSSVVLTWFASRWRPQLPRRRSGTRSLLHFGANLTASSFLWSIARGSDGLLIGRLYGPTPLGLYNRAGVLVMRPVQQFIIPIESVFVPVLSRLQTQPERYRRVVLQAFEAIALASFLFTGLLLGLSHPLTVAVLGQKWEPAAPIFAGFTLVALYVPIGSVATWLLTSQGRGREFLVASSIASCSTVVAFLVGLPFGPVGVAMSYSAFCIFVALPINYYVAGRRGPVTTKDLWGRFFTHLPLWVVVCAVTWFTRSLVLNADKWEQLAICTPVGLLAGIGFICIYPPARRVALSLIFVLREWIKSRKVVF